MGLLHCMIGGILPLFLIMVSCPSLAQVHDRVYSSKHREANRLLELAQENIDKQDYNLALTLINQALQYQTDHVEGYFNRALVKEKIGDSEGAITDYQIVLLLDSTFREAAFNRAKLRYHEKQYQRAKRDFQQVLTMASSGTRMVYFKGTALNNKENVPMQSITTAYSMEADVYNYIGLCDQAAGDVELSLVAFNKALSLNPGEANYYVNRGLSYGSLDNSENAIYDFQAALKLAPEHPIAQFNLTQELESSGKLELAAYDEIIAQSPEFTSAYVNRALAKINSGDLSGAITDYDRAIVVDPSDPIIYVNRGLAKEQVNDFRGALTDYNAAIKLNPKEAKAFRSRGRVLFELMEFQFSLEDLDEAIRLDPQHGGAYFNRALVHHQLGNQDDTCSDLQMAETLGVEGASRALQSYCKNSN